MKLCRNFRRQCARIPCSPSTGRRSRYRFRRWRRCRRRDGADRVFHQDWLGSTRHLSRPDGVDVSHVFRYEGYGWPSHRAGEDPYPTEYQWAGGWGYEYEPLARQRLVGAERRRALARKAGLAGTDTPCARFHPAGRRAARRKYSPGSALAQGQPFRHLPARRDGRNALDRGATLRPGGARCRSRAPSWWST